MGHDPLPAIYFAIVLVVVILAAMLGAVVGPMALPVVPGKDKQLGSKPGFGAFGGVAGGLLGLLAGRGQSEFCEGARTIRLPGLIGQRRSRHRSRGPIGVPAPI